MELDFKINVLSQTMAQKYNENESPLPVKKNPGLECIKSITHSSGIKKLF
jgi:hypothetical protein